jgi:MFS family permease
MTAPHDKLDPGSGEDGAPSQSTRPESPYAVLRNRNYVLYLVGRFIASFGQQMLTVAVMWELYDRTDSALALAFVGLTHMVPMFLFTLPAGHLADTLNRKHIILAMTGVMAVASTGLALVSALRGPTFLIYACLFTAGSARTFLWPASSSFLPQLVPRHVFPRAVTWSTGSFHLSSVAGPAAGGGLIALTGGAMLVYALNTAAALICLILVSLVRYRPIVLSREPMTLNSLVTGFRFVFSHQVVFGVITLDLFAVLLGGATALLPIYARDILHAGPGGLGLLNAALPVGALVSAIILAHRPPMQKAGRAMLWSVAAFGVTTIGFGFSQWFWLSWLMLFLCGATDNVSVIVRHTLVQLLTPDEKRGRVSAVNSLFIGTSNELGGFRAGMVAHWFGPVASVAFGGLGTIIAVAVVALIWPAMRRYGPLETT